MNQPHPLTNTQIVNKTIDRKILLNPGPATTSARVKAALVTPDLCPRGESFGELMETVRTKILHVAGGEIDYETVLLACSGTGAMESCLVSLEALRPDSSREILILVNGNYGQRMQEICNAFQIAANSLNFPIEEAIDAKVVTEHLQEYPHRYYAMVFIHHETTTGALNPLKELVALAQTHQLKTVVDAMSSFGGIPIDLHHTPVDFIIASANKCLHAMAGLSFVIARRQLMEKMADLPIRHYYFNLYQNYRSQKYKREFLFTAPVQLLYSLNEAIEEFYEEGGVEQRHARYGRLYHQISQGMLNMGFRFYVEEKFHSKILTTYWEPTSEHYSFHKMYTYFLQNGITIYPGKVSHKNTFRLSNIGQLESSDIEKFLSCMKQFLLDSHVNLQ